MSSQSERLFRAIDRAKGGREFKDTAEAQAFMNQFVGVNIDDLVASQDLSPAERAQELTYEAKQARSREECLWLLREAVSLDPGCCDAQVGLAGLEARNLGELRFRLEAALASEAARLGPAIFKEDKGHFWGFDQTRPYMRTRFQLAETHCEMGEFKAAQKHFAAMILLNKNDNQGVRKVLGPLCLRIGDLKAYRILRNKFKRLEDLELLWCDVLAAFLAEDLDGAAKAVQKAKAGNGFMEAYLLGHKKVPRLLPSSYTWGSREEAICAALYLVPAWDAHPQARVWLAKNRGKR